MSARSPFPAGYCGADLLLGATWTPIELSRTSSDGIRITRSRQSGASLDPGTMTVGVSNEDGRYSPRNPRSPLYGQIGRNTPVRAWVELGQVRAVIPTANDWWQAPDAAPLDVTGDIDIRVDVKPATWRPGIQSLIGASKVNAWSLLINASGSLTFRWADAGFTTRTIDSAAVVPITHGRQAIRVTLDVNDGTGGRTATFYTSPTLAGPWVQMGVPTVVSGTTAITNSTGALRAVLDQDTSPGEVYGIELRNGINGAVVAAPSFTTPSAGVTSFSDGVGNTWSPGGTAASISRRHYRFFGVVSEWPQTWGTTGGPSVVAQLACAGVTRRLSQGAPATASPYRLAMSELAVAGALVAYWPLEDAEGSTRATSGIPDRRPLEMSGVAAFGSASPFISSDPLPALGSGVLGAAIEPYAVTGQTQIRWLGIVPAGATGGSVLLRAYLSGTLGWVDVVYQTTTGGSLRLDVYGNSGSLLLQLTTTTGLTDKAIRVGVELVQSGANVNVQIMTYLPGAPAGFFTSSTVSAQTVGRVSTVQINPQGVDLAQTVIGHLTVETAISSLFDVSGDVLSAWSGQSARNRIRTVGNQVGLATVFSGAGPGVGAILTEALGPQRSRDVMGLMTEAAEADGGALFEPRTGVGDLAYRSLGGLAAQDPALAITYTDNLLIPFTPTDDDSLTRNRVSVARDGGSSATVEVTTGQLATGTVGTYADDVTLSLATDAQADNAAGWRAHLGTHDEARWTIGLDLAHPSLLASPSLTRQILAVDIGDRVDVAHSLAWLPPDPVQVLVDSVTETIDPLHYRIEWATRPYRPYRIGRYNTAADRYSGSGTVLTSGVTSTATSWTVTPPSGVLWTAANGAYDLLVAGERVRVTAVTGSGPTQTLTVTRSVNGIVKAQTAGAAIALYDPVYVGL